MNFSLNRPIASLVVLLSTLLLSIFAGALLEVSSDANSNFTCNSFAVAVIKLNCRNCGLEPFMLVLDSSSALDTYAHPTVACTEQMIVEACRDG